MRTIALVDHTRRHPPSAGIFEAIAEALTIQVERDFAPAWGVPATRFTVGGRGDKIHFFDSAHQAGDYGWHIVQLARTATRDNDFWTAINAAAIN